MNTPTHLFHYTTIDTLALILKNKSIRFNSLSRVDDLSEQESSDLGKFGKFCYASCWTADKQENIALWNMYSKNGSGIRIQLPIHPFKKNKIEITNNSDNPTFVDSHYKSFGIRNEKGQLLFNFTPFYEVNLLPVHYTDDEHLNTPKIYNQEGNRITIDWGLLGNVKSSSWSFQNEWRFSFCAVPSILIALGSNNNDIQKLKQVCERIDPPFDYYDISIDDTCFAEMEILMGPSTTEADLIIVNSLIKDLNPTAKITKSNLSNVVKFKH